MSTFYCAHQVDRILALVMPYIAHFSILRKIAFIRLVVVVRFEHFKPQTKFTYALSTFFSFIVSSIHDWTSQTFLAVH